jgi:hypothetical protein
MAGEKMCAQHGGEVIGFETPRECRGLTRTPIDAYPTAQQMSILGGIRQRIRVLESEGLTPWRIEIGSEMAERLGHPTALLGLPVEVVPLADYFRVAFTEWAVDHVPNAHCRQR